MKLRSAAILAGAMAAASPTAFAKQDIQAWPIADVLTNPEYQTLLNGVSFTWGEEIHGPAVATSNVARATPGIMRSDKETCERAFVDALREMRLHALERGAHSVQAIKSTITGAPYASNTEYLCMTGHTNSRVELEGKIVMEAAPNQYFEDELFSESYDEPDLVDRGGRPAAPIIFQQRSADQRPESIPHIDPEQDDIYGTPWED